MSRAGTWVLAAALAAAGTAARAETSLEGVHWQVARLEGGRVASWQDLRVLQDGPPKLDNRLRARLVVKNRGPKEEDGILVRYALTARIAPTGGAPGAEGTWAVPFTVDEKRVPKVGPNKIVDVTLDAGAAIELYLRRLTRAGWWPDRIKIEAMLEPRSGASSVHTVEDTLEIRP